MPEWEKLFCTRARFVIGLVNISDFKVLYSLTRRILEWLIILVYGYMDNTNSRVRDSYEALLYVIARSKPQNDKLNPYHTLISTARPPASNPVGHDLNFASKLISISEAEKK